MRANTTDDLWRWVQRGAESECWPWTGHLEDGYGRVRYGANKRMPAHRLAYTLLIGEIPAGLQLDHLCRNRACCNPAHLEPVDTRTNLMRGDTHAARNAAKTNCHRGHEFTESNTYVDRLNKRNCRTCRQDRKKARRARARLTQEGATA